MKPRWQRRPGGLPTLIAFSLAVLMGGSAGAQEAPAPPALEPLAKDALLAGQDVPVPSRKKYVAPVYPAQAAIEGIRGIVILEVLIGEDGKVSEARVTRSIPGLDEAALTAVRLWEYEPTKAADKPVKVILSQSITFALRLPELQRSLGVPELKSGGAPPVPASLATPATASVSVILGAQGEVTEAAVLDGNAVLSDALLRAVKSWRFVISEGSTPPTFTVQANWNPGARPNLTLSATDATTDTAQTGPPSPAPADRATPAMPGADAQDQPTSTEAPMAPSPEGPQTPPAPVAPAPASGSGAAADGSAPQTAPTASADVATEVLPARPEPPAREEGVSGVADVVLGENIPDLVRGRRPVWPPLARLGNVTGEVVVRFSVDLAGRVTVHSAEGVELLKDAAEQGVGTWLFRRTAIDRLHLVATFTFGSDRTMAKVARAE